MGQSWWWVVLAVVIIALLVAVALQRSRNRRGDATAAANIEIAAAAAGGTAGAVGAAAVAAVRAERDVTEPVDESAPGEPQAAASADTAHAGAADVHAAEPGAAEPGAAEPGAAEPGAAEPGAAEPDAAAADAGTGSSAPVDAVDQESEEGSGERAEPSIPAPRDAGSVDRKPPEPAGSALAALDTALVGPASPVAEAAAAVSAATAQPGPYPGSLLPAEGGTSPSPVHVVKANEGSRRYHTPDSPYYLRTRGDAWFRTAEEARAAGFTAWNDRG
ncbi:hypothetical protein FB388_6796 [Pseudonocardia cypriaca]|uniref:Uncharacterized protein n=1 Tax=Pseudonocardia cypriaca TaxID=882449 RepID=A0A543FNT1_9PSEU|nr:hypothetical protein [Pseudonocardia cypriaca]TQM35364.1 hypothetical protein FB388_6796 [Pseudonocardia cypriaca]